MRRGDERAEPDSVRWRKATRGSGGEAPSRARADEGSAREDRAALTAPSRARVGAEVLLADMRAVHVRVDLGRRDVGVAEHLLDGAQIGAALEEMGRERMAQGVGMQAVPADGAPRARHDGVDALAGEPPSSTGRRGSASWGRASSR